MKHNFIVTIFLAFLFSLYTHAATDMVKAYMRTNGYVKKYCQRTFKNKKIEKDCYSWWQKHVKSECGRKPYENCFFDEKKLKYKGAGSNKKWVEIDKLIDKEFK